MNTQTPGRRTKALTLILTALLSGLCTLQISAEEISSCDLEAGHPSDPDKVGQGKGSSEVVTHVAIPACRAALESDPGNPRYHYQLGRAMYYWAGANDADTTEALEHLKLAVDQNYSQAMFVLGLLYKRQGDSCAAEPLTRQAAEQGLKSARISYVNDVLAGSYKDCPENVAGPVTKSEMEAYLEAAAGQVSGYYENMLLENLKRQLDLLN